MLKILLVEDNLSKVRKITNVLVSCGISIEDINHVSCKMSALSELAVKLFDVLLLDMMIPDRLDEEPNPDGGIDLLSEITDRDNYTAPRYVIAVTQFSDLFEKNNQTLLNKNFSAIYYDEVEDFWKKQLIERIEQIILVASVKSQSSNSSFKALAVIICALESIELENVLSNGWEWTSVDIANDDTAYFKASIISSDNRVKEVYAAACSRMGMPSASVLSMKVIHHFQPEFLIMTGIMAAIRGKANYGDIVIPDIMWDYGSGKVGINIDNRGSVFLHEPYQLHLDTSLKSLVNKMRTDEDLMFKIKKEFKYTKPQESLRVHIGPVASGAAVLADGESIKRVQEQHRKLIGIEMEAYAVFLAAQESFYPKPKAICIKSVVDFADEHKDDRFHSYAGYTSAAFAKKLVENYLL